MQLGDREPERPGVAGQVHEPREVAAGRVGAALDDVTGGDRAGERVVVVRAPPEAPDAGADHDRRVGHPAGDHHVGPRGECPGDAEAAQVGVRGQRTLEAELAGAGGQVVAVDDADRRRQAQPGGRLADALGQADRVEAAGVGHDAHPALERVAQALLDLGDERAGVAERRVAQLVLAQDQHGELGQVVAGDHVDRSAVEHLAHGRQAVAVEPRAVGDDQRFGRRAGRAARGVAHHVAPLVGVRPEPGGPANAWAMSSHRSASAPVATRSRSSRWRRWVTSRQKS